MENMETHIKRLKVLIEQKEKKLKREQKNLNLLKKKKEYYEKQLDLEVSPELLIL